jgi:GNAT superfamily N-acetyltransferase
VALDAPSSPTPDVRDLVDEAIAAARATRGGGELLAALRLGADPAADLCARGALRVALDGGRPIGLAVVDAGVLAAIYVAPSRRRSGVASAIAREVLAEPSPPADAWALPGDRATKSLYESLGMKARLLTMRAE